MDEVLGNDEHSIGLCLGDDVLVVELPQDVAALSATDFMM